MWQGLVGSPLHQVSRDVRSRGRLEAGATRAPGGASEAGQATSATGQRASERASKQASRWRCRQVSREREGGEKGERRRKRAGKSERAWAQACGRGRRGQIKMGGHGCRAALVECCC